MSTMYREITRVESTQQISLIAQKIHSLIMSPAKVQRLMRAHTL